MGYGLECGSGNGGNQAHVQDIVIHISFDCGAGHSGVPGCVQITGAESAPLDTSEATPDVSPALLMDARSYAADYGVELDEAIGILIGQEAIGELDQELQSSESATFGGLWIQNEPDYRVVVAFTREGEETIRPYVDGSSVADIVEVRQVEMSLVELKKARREAVSMVKELGFKASSGIDLPNNMVELYLTAKEIEKLEIELQKSGLTLPNRVELVEESPPSPA